jgi:glycosyltransferase involved in cell wall biosynthesis
VTIRQTAEAEPRPSALLVHSYVTPEAIAGLLVAKAMRIPALLMGESELIRRRSLAKRILRSALLPSFLKLFDAYLCIGTQDRLFYQHYRVERRRLFFTPYSVDNDAFLQVLEWNLAKRDHTRHTLGVAPGDKVLLFSGKLIPRKRPVDLVDAVALLEPRERPFLVYVGSGSLEPAIRARAAAHGVTKLAITGFKNTDEIGAYYAAADAFALPSEFETWGLVVNEAMVHSLPVIVSNGCGCGPDLVREGQNGYCFPVGDVRLLAQRILSVLGNESRRRELGARARVLIGSWSYAEVEQGVRTALAFLTAAGSPPAPARRALDRARSVG